MNEDKTTEQIKKMDLDIFNDSSYKQLDTLWRLVSVCEAREKEIENNMTNEFKKGTKFIVEQAIKQERDKVKEAIEKLSQTQAVFNKFTLLKELNLEDRNEKNRK